MASAGCGNRKRGPEGVGLYGVHHEAPQSSGAVHGLPAGGRNQCQVMVLLRKNVK